MEQRKRVKILKIVTILFVAAALIAVLAPVFLPGHTNCGAAMCQSNLKEIALAVQMYAFEHDDMLPSSATSGSSDETFRKTLGNLSPETSRAQKKGTIVELLYPYKQRKDVFLCPWSPMADDIAKTSPESDISYILKKSINQAWSDPKIKARSLDDYKYQSEQILFYERTECPVRHKSWSESLSKPSPKGDVSDPHNKHKLHAKINCAFMDGHVKRRTLLEHEPDYYNWNVKTDKPSEKPEIDPRVYADRLR